MTEKPVQHVDSAQLFHEEDIMAEKYNLVTLDQAMPTSERAAKWLARRSLVRNSYQCPTCSRACALYARQNIIDGMQWHCRLCRHSKSIRDGSFFSKSHLPLNIIMRLIYCWAIDMPQEVACRETGVKPNSMVDWYNFLRGECQSYLNRHPVTVGGFNEAGEPMVVEIDETKNFHRKYGHWVFGGVERGSGKCFMVEVADRTEATLTPLIEAHILPGTHIISDGWRAYNNIGAMQGGIYLHSVIIRERNFVDPVDPNIHIQNVENLWMRLKRKLRRQYGTTRLLFPGYLKEFVVRNMFREDDLFSRMIVCIRENYGI
ncbi:uncharacterized protein [Periplaneta americana]|uniref:uncharacterized protein n=1 Tax=Periplaneta americana TaxID=6978 RepID=UPI0037E80377